MIKSKRRKIKMSKYELPKNFNYTDVNILKQFITETGKIIPARVTGVTASNQRKLTKYIKIARFLALIPYTDMHK
jgi:small subunit ribosomal protein S18